MANVKFKCKTMKKKWDMSPPDWIGRKIVRIMQLSFMSNLVCLLTISAGTFSQTKMFNLSLKDANLKEVFDKLEKQSDISFFYHIESLDLSKKITVNYKDAKLTDVLEQLLVGTDLSYRIMDQYVAIIKKPGQGYSDNQLQQDRQITVTGKVTDDKGEPIPGVNIYDKINPQHGVITGIDGSYSISVNSPEDVLVFSFIGFDGQEITVAGRTVINVILVVEETGLDEVLVVGYGTVKKKDVTGSIVNVKTEDLEDLPAGSVAQAIQGRVPGVTILNNGGSPAEDPQIRIRGLSTLNSEGPLWIVDGVVNANGVDMNEVESITILKDASAAIYGTRAAGGVILVETKKGKKGLRVDVNAKYGWRKPWKQLDVLDAQGYIDVYSEAYQNSGLPIPDMFSDPYFMKSRTDWLDAIFQTGVTQDYSVTISGGSEKSTFSVFGNFKDIEGTLHNTYSKSARIRMKSDHKITDWLTIGENVSVTTRQSLGANTTSGYSGSVLGAVYYPPSAKIWSDEQNGIYSGVVDPNEVDVSLGGQFGDLLNPYAHLDRANAFNPNIDFMGNAYVILDIVEGLSFKSNISFNYSQNYNKQFTYKILEPGKVFDYNRLFTSAGVDKSLVAEQLLTYKKKFNAHNISVLAGYTAEEYINQGFQVAARGFSIEDEWAQEYANASEFGHSYDLPQSHFGDYSMVSVLGRVAYSYADKYYLTGVVRQDGTSKVMKDNRWGTFPSVSAAWRISDEEFMSGLEFLGDLKIRASWGKMGNISPLGNYEFSVPLSSNYHTIIGKNPVPVQLYYQNGISNEDLKWETTTSKDIGFDALMLDSKLSLAFDYYNKTVDDMLFPLELSQFSGVDNYPWDNVGSVKNRGYELMLGWRDQAGEFKYDVSINMAHNTNELLALSSETDFQMHGDHVRSTLRPYRSEVGQPLYSYYLIENDGIFQSDAEAQAYTKDGEMIQPNAKAGDLKFVDLNDDGTIDSDDKRFCGDYYPDFTYGLNISLGYKNFDCSMFFQGVQGVDIFAGYKLTTYKPTQGYNLLAEGKNAWSVDNKGADIPRLQMQDPNNNYSTESDWYLEDGSYLRLKNFNLGYTLPNQLLSASGISKLRLYIASENLLTITGYKGFDPEVGEKGLDMMKYPQARTFMIGANISF